MPNGIVQAFIYVETSGGISKSAGFSINGDYSGTRPVLTFTEGPWTDYTIPFSALKVTGLKEVIIKKKVALRR